MKGRVWVNFKELRAKLQFEDVLRHYGVEICRDGDQHQGPCPLPVHKGPRGGKPFSANLKRGLFNAFCCDKGGDVLKFAAFMEGVDPDDGQALRKVAVELQTRFCPEGASSRTKRAEKAKTAEEKALSAAVNAPLDFALKGLETGHQSVTDLGLTPDTAAFFGIGFCTRGLLKGRIAIPLDDGSGRLVGFAGLGTGAESGDYLFPGTRERKGIVHEFRKSLLLYNRHRVEPSCASLIVVQCPASAWVLHQNRFLNVVALLGAECSSEQFEQIAALVRPSGRVWLMPDGGPEGDALAHSFVGRMSALRFVRRIVLPAGTKPFHLSVEELESKFA